jgi:predicted nuclease of predicted toxin-antitoxin system
LRILFDKNVPVGIRRFLPEHEVRTVVQMQWPERLKNGELLKAAEEAGFQVMVTCDQNIRYQQNLAGLNLAIVTLGSNILPLVRQHEAEIAQAVDSATPGSYSFIEMPLPPKPRKGRRL